MNAWLPQSGVWANNVWKIPKQEEQQRFFYENSLHNNWYFELRFKV